MDPLAAFAANVAAARRAAGLTQEALAAKADLSMAYVGRIERAEKDPSVRTIARLARGLDVQVEALFAGVPQADDQTPRKARAD